MQDPIRILLLAADPENRTRLRLGEEFHKIQDELRRGHRATHFELEHSLSTRVEEMLRAIHNFQPHIMHFGGHGSADGDLCFEDAEGNAHSVAPAKLERFFSLISRQVDCVVLNSCYSVQQAEVITKHIPYVVGMRDVVTDEAAIRFAVGFYQALAGGSSIPRAFEFGCVLVETAVGDQALQAELKVAWDAEKKLSGVYGEAPPIVEQRSPDAKASRSPAVNTGEIKAGRDAITQGDNGTVARDTFYSDSGRSGGRDA